MLQTVVVLLARQMRLLNRQVVLESESPIPTSGTSTVVSEIKIKGHKKKNAIEPRTSKSYASEPRQKTDNAKIMTDKNFPAIREHSMREFNQSELTVWSSEGNSRESIAVESLQSETTLRNKKYNQLLEKIEQQREKVLRVINQRKNSRDTGIISPSPMTSLPSTEIEFEKLLIVENIPEEKKDHKCLPLVTRDVFDELVQKVHNLEKRADDGVIGLPEFPENIKLMQELRKGASLTEAMAALQISARLGATEKTLQRIAFLVGATGLDDKSTKNIPSTSELQLEDVQKPNNSESAVSMSKTEAADDMHASLYVTKNDLHASLDETQAEIMGKMKVLINKINSTIEENTKQAYKLEMRLGDALNTKEKFQEIERKIITNSNQLNVIDTGLTSQMTNLLEQLSQVQLDLEAGLANMTENLTNKGIDSEEITELNRNFATLKMDIETAGVVQRDLNDVQKTLAFEIDRLKYEVELLRDIKCDRDEVEDALRDKAGIKDLNGMVTDAQFEAAFSCLEKEINGTYLTFKQQEITWQKAINDIFDSLNEKVRDYQLEELRLETTKNLNKLKCQIDCIKKLLGEPLAASVSRKIYRDTTCLSCANPAHIMPPDDKTPALPPLKPSGVSAEIQALKPAEDRLPSCIAGLKITHPIDPRAEICTRYCGGSHTKKRHGMTRKRSSMRLEGKPFLKPELIDFVGACDGKRYQTEDEIVLKPCLPCNQELGSGEGAIARPSILDQSILASINSSTTHVKRSKSDVPVYKDKNENSPSGEELSNLLSLTSLNNEAQE